MDEREQKLSTTVIGENIVDNPDQLRAAIVEKQLTVYCGANVQRLDNVAGMTVGTLRGRMREILNITRDHQMVRVNGAEVGNDFVLKGTEEVEFIKPAGEKGSALR